MLLLAGRSKRAVPLWWPTRVASPPARLVLLHDNALCALHHGRLHKSQLLCLLAPHVRHCLGPARLCEAP